MKLDDIDFAKGNGLVPAIIQDVNTAKVLMLGYMNREAFEKTEESGVVTFYSRSKERLWTKGETSGNSLSVVDMALDCDGDTLLVKVTPTGPVCHTGSDTCFREKNESSFDIYKLASIIKDRKSAKPEDSYTSLLFHKGLNKIAQKVGEEAVELVIEAKDTNDQLFIGEAADLLYHYLVLLEYKNIYLDDIHKELERRHSTK